MIQIPDAILQHGSLRSQNAHFSSDCAESCQDALTRGLRHL